MMIPSLKLTSSLSKMRLISTLKRLLNVNKLKKLMKNNYVFLVVIMLLPVLVLIANNLVSKLLLKEGFESKTSYFSTRRIWRR